MNSPIATRARELSEARVAFVHATVVRAQVPSSARPGDDAIVLSDGSIEGFVGGQCTESSVRSAALGALRDGETVLLRVLPDGTQEFPAAPGAQVVVNPCLSGGALEIFLRPVLPAPLVAVIGSSPVAEAVFAIGAVLGYTVEHLDANGTSGADLSQADAVVVATHGRDELSTIRAALAAGVPYLALVASRRRGGAVLDELDLDEAERGRVSTPAGLDIGARTAAEVALSILAEVVTVVRRGEPRAARTVAGPGRPVDPAVAEPVLDPVCGMTVTPTADSSHLDVDGVRLWFCADGCRDRHAELIGR